jgi:hypothetical protein
MRYIALLLMCTCLTLIAKHATTAERYDFRNAKAYTSLSQTDRGKLEQVHRDFMMLWGALDRYADDHGGQPPEKLDQLVPGYLAELPSDPFATKKTSAEKPKHGTVSKGGWGYRYTRGPMFRTVGEDHGNRSWVISSVGLPEFPYLAKRGNIGLYVAKGIWL